LFTLLLNYFLRATAAPIDAFRHAIHSKYNIDISIFTLLTLLTYFFYLAYLLTFARESGTNRRLSSRDSFKV